MSDTDLLFVYGTLRRGTGHRMQLVLQRGTEFVDSARFQGRLYSVARYPGIIASDDPGDQVVGDVFRLQSPADLLRRLDRYEACNPADPDSPYVREQRGIRLDSGRTCVAWIYLYNRPIKSLTRIASGDFLLPVHD